MKALPLPERYRKRLRNIPRVDLYGRLLSFNGLVIESDGPDAKIGELCEVELGHGAAPVRAEVVGFRAGRVLLMSYGVLRGVSAGARIKSLRRFLRIPVGRAFVGRVIDPFGRPLDQGRLIEPEDFCEIQRKPINPMQRVPLDTALETGVRAIDGLLPLAKGQRVGIFAGSGVGKSTLLGMMARHVHADVVVVAMVGERGREVGEFLDQCLGEEGRKRSVVLVATADQPALVRAHAVHAAHAMAEYFSGLGKDVLLMVDSITRFAMAQREIGLAVDEPPTSRGYPPSVFSLLPQILERAGRLGDGGSITAVYSVLVEGDDMNEPVADHMRAILDGHFVLSRDLAARGQLPAIDTLSSVSRLVSTVASKEERAFIQRVRLLLSTYEASRDLIDMGAYQQGANATLDEAIDRHSDILGFLQQSPTEYTSRTATLERLRAILDSERSHA